LSTPRAKTPASIHLAPGDAGFVIREGGELELFMPQMEGDESVPPDHVVLAGFAMAFHDERLRDLLTKIIGEKQH
jgi:hypothetical protein